MRTSFSEVFAVHEIREKALNQALELHADTSWRATFLDFKAPTLVAVSQFWSIVCGSEHQKGVSVTTRSGMARLVYANLKNAFLDGLGQLLCDVGLCTEFQDCARSLTCRTRCLGREASHCVTIPTIKNDMGFEFKVDKQAKIVAPSWRPELSNKLLASLAHWTALVFNASLATLVSSSGDAHVKADPAKFAAADVVDVTSRALCLDMATV